jgi:hypothetical protein
MLRLAGALGNVAGLRRRAERRAFPAPFPGLIGIGYGIADVRMPTIGRRRRGRHWHFGTNFLHSDLGAFPNAQFRVQVAKPECNNFIQSRMRQERGKIRGQNVTARVYSTPSKTVPSWLSDGFQSAVNAPQKPTRQPRKDPSAQRALRAAIGTQIRIFLGIGRGSRVRTRDLRFWRPSLYQLSYTPKATHEVWQPGMGIKQLFASGQELTGLRRNPGLPARYSAAGRMA